MAHYVRPPNRRTSGSSAQVGDATSSRATVALGRQVSNNMGQGDVNRLRQTLHGNALDSVKVVTFVRANEDVFVSHKLGYKVSNFEAESPSQPAKFYVGSRPPNIYGMWIRCDTAGVTARIRMHGQREANG